MKFDGEIMEILAAYDLTGSFRGAAELTGCSHHTVARYVAARDAGQPIAEPAYRGRVTDPFLPKIEEWVEKSNGKIRADIAHEGFRWVTVGAPGDTVSIVLSDYVDGTEDEVAAVGSLVAKGGLNAVHFSSDDLDATFESLKKAGVEIVQEPTQQPWGARDGAVRDPSGNMVRINQA